MYIGVWSRRAVGWRWLTRGLSVGPPASDNKLPPSPSSSPPPTSPRNTIVFSSNTAVNYYFQAAYEKILGFMSVYEEAIGLREIREAQQKVLEAETRFGSAQVERRELSLRSIEIQQNIKNVRAELMNLKRTDQKFASLFLKETELLNEEDELLHKYKMKEKEERDLFTLLSASLRDSQEKERVRAERLKYLQLSFSIACTVLGILSAFVYNYFRNTQIRQVIENEDREFKNTNTLISQVKDGQSSLVSVLQNQLNTQSDLIKQLLSEAAQAGKTAPLEGQEQLPPTSLQEAYSSRESLVQSSLKIFMISFCAASILHILNKINP